MALARIPVRPSLPKSSKATSLTGMSAMVQRTRVAISGQVILAERVLAHWGQLNSLFSFHHESEVLQFGHTTLTRAI